MYSFVMEQCNFKIRHLFKIFLVFNTANDFTMFARHLGRGRQGEVRCQHDRFYREEGETQLR
jgi:hypothetical protein